MSSGGAEVIGRALEIPVLREIVIAGMWLVGMRYAIDQRDWSFLGLLVGIGVVAAAIFWWLYNRKREQSGGGWKILLVVMLLFMLLPLLLVAWSRRKARAHG